MQRFAVFGNPIAHSLSPLLHNYAIKFLALDAYYGRVLLQRGEELRAKFEALKLCGSNVTVPFKLDAFKACDVLSDTAKQIGSVNTLVLQDGALHGFNTDAQGFFRAVSGFGKIHSALVLGAGGTSRAVGYALRKNGVKFDILNRSTKNFDFGCEEFFTYENFKFKSYDLIADTTGAGLGDDVLPAPDGVIDEILSRAKFAFDAVYGKQTAFLRAARTKGLACKDGKEMLINQGALAFNLFFGEKFNIQEIAVLMDRAAALR